MRKDTEVQKAHWRVVMVAVAGLLLLGACGKDNGIAPLQNAGVTTTSVPAGVQLASCPTGTFIPSDMPIVAMKNESFTPQVLTVPVNSTVMWTNNDASGNYWINMGSFESTRVGPGQGVCIEFTSPGTFEYHCDPQVTGTVIVQPAPAK